MGIIEISFCRFYMIIQTGGILMTHQLFSAIDKIFHSHPQRGAILVLFAITFPFLMAFSAIAVDLGTVYVQRVHLQNAADAAALAGAYQLGNSSDDPAVNSAVSYTTKNSPSDITVTFSDSTMPSEEKQINLSSDINRKSSYSTIEVQLRERVPLYFFRYFGMENMPIAVTATAKYVPGSSGTFDGIFNYALAGGSTSQLSQDNYYSWELRQKESIWFNTSANSIIINGDILTNGQILMDNPHAATINGTIIGNKNINPTWVWNNDNKKYYTTADKNGNDSSVSYNDNTTDISYSENNKNVSSLYNYINTVKNMSTEERASQHIYYNLADLNSSFRGQYAKTINGYTGTTDNGSNTYTVIIVNKDIEIDNLQNPSGNLIVISLSGSITLNNQYPMSGIFYAPQGTILIQSAINITGSVVGNQIKMTAPGTITSASISSGSSSSTTTKGSVTLIK